MFFSEYKKLNIILVQADIEQVKFVNVINIDHLQIDQSNRKKSFLGKNKKSQNIHKIVQ
jgi:hypothetical protein